MVSHMVLCLYKYSPYQTLFKLPNRNVTDWHTTPTDRVVMLYGSVLKNPIMDGWRLSTASLVKGILKMLFLFSLFSSILFPSLPSSLFFFWWHIIVDTSLISPTSFNWRQHCIVKSAWDFTPNGTGMDPFIPRPSQAWLLKLRAGAGCLESWGLSLLYKTGIITLTLFSYWSWNRWHL